jgi:hypothetical protein
VILGETALPHIVEEIANCEFFNKFMKPFIEGNLLWPMLIRGEFRHLSNNYGIGCMLKRVKPVNFVNGNLGCINTFTESMDGK